ncbi:unnamed protein product [Pedinophyceae sp. YPF-701]|nr:unnamed protein product [Pedinophyceae sp. YPF-701]
MLSAPGDPTPEVERMLDCGSRIRAASAIVCEFATHEHQALRGPTHTNKRAALLLRSASALATCATLTISHGVCDKHGVNTACTVLGRHTPLIKLLTLSRLDISRLRTSAAALAQALGTAPEAALTVVGTSKLSHALRGAAVSGVARTMPEAVHRLAALAATPAGLLRASPVDVEHILHALNVSSYDVSDPSRAGVVAALASFLATRARAAAKTATPPPKQLDSPRAAADAHQRKPHAPMLLETVAGATIALSGLRYYPGDHFAAAMAACAADPALAPVRQDDTERPRAARSAVGVACALADLGAALPHDTVTALLGRAWEETLARNPGAQARGWGRFSDTLGRVAAAAAMLSHDAEVWWESVMVSVTSAFEASQRAGEPAFDATSMLLDVADAVCASPVAAEALRAVDGDGKVLPAALQARYERESDPELHWPLAAQKTVVGLLHPGGDVAAAIRKRLGAEWAVREGFLAQSVVGDGPIMGHFAVPIALLSRDGTWRLAVEIAGRDAALNDPTRLTGRARLRRGEMLRGGWGVVRVAVQRGRDRKPDVGDLARQLRAGIEAAVVAAARRTRREM